MPKYKDELQNYHQERIQDILTLRPSASLVFIQKALERDPKQPLNLDLHYISKLRRKIILSRRYQYQRSLPQEEVAKIEELSQRLKEPMWEILLSRESQDKDRISAARLIVEVDHKLAELKMNTGIITRKVGELDVKHEHKHYLVPPEMKAQIIRALVNYGIVEKTQSHDELQNQPKQLPSPS